MIKILTFNTFLEGFEVLKTRFEFEADALYTKLVYDTLRSKINLEIFNNTLRKIIKHSKKDWQSRYNSKNRPDLADWIDAFMPATITRNVYKDNILVDSYEDYPDWYYNDLKVIRDQLKFFRYEKQDLSSTAPILY